MLCRPLRTLPMASQRRFAAVIHGSHNRPGAADLLGPCLKKYKEPASVGSCVARNESIQPRAVAVL